MKSKAAIYHFTNESKQRPKIYRDQLEALKAYAESVGLDVADIYCDMSLKRSERTEFDRLLANADQYEALVTKDFYHIAKNTGKCLDVMQQLRDKGLQIYSIPATCRILFDDSWNNQNLRSAHKCICSFATVAKILEKSFQYPQE